MGRAENIKVFEHTQEFCRENSRVSDSIKISITEQKLILEDQILPVIKYDRYQKPAQIIVSQKRTFEAAGYYRDNKVAVLNFASASNPGGGVAKGAGAQEECLCRCSGLYFCLNTQNMWDGFYKPHRQARNPIHNDDIIYTPNVVVFKTDTVNPQLLPENEWYDVDVITCAAPNLRSRPSNSYNSGDGQKATHVKDKELLDIHEKRLRRILDVAVLEGAETIILGAFGCGAFSNNPEIVARASRNVLDDYLYAFKNIHYAVYCRPKDERNFKIFKRVLEKYSNI